MSESHRHSWSRHCPCLMELQAHRWEPGQHLGDGLRCPPCGVPAPALSCPWWITRRCPFLSPDIFGCVWIWSVIFAHSSRGILCFRGMLCERWEHKADEKGVGGKGERGSLRLVNKGPPPSTALFMILRSCNKSRSVLDYVKRFSSVWFCFLKYIFILSSLEKKPEESTESSHITHTQIPIIISYLSMGDWSHLMKQYWYVFINWSPRFIQTSLVFP